MICYSLILYKFCRANWVTSLRFLCLRLHEQECMYCHEHVYVFMKIQIHLSKHVDLQPPPSLDRTETPHVWTLQLRVLGRLSMSASSMIALSTVCLAIPWSAWKPPHTQECIAILATAPSAWKLHHKQECIATLSIAWSAWTPPHTQESVLLFSKLNKIFFGYFDPEKIFLDNENK